MAAIPNPQRSAKQKHLYTFFAITAAVIVFAGFAQTYYLKTFFANEALPLLLHFHGLVMTSWFVLFFVQARLVASHRVDLHRRLGIFGAVLALLVVVLGMTVIVSAAARPHEDPGDTRFFLELLCFSLIQLSVFAGLVGGAIAFRRRSDIHKRLMLLATLMLLPSALSRIPLNFIHQGDLNTLLLVDLCILVCIAVDTFRQRRLHPVFAWGGLLVIGSMHLGDIGGQTETWINFATLILR